MTRKIIISLALAFVGLSSGSNAATADLAKIARVYPMGMNNAWDGVIKALNNHHVLIASANREIHEVVTDYMSNGQSFGGIDTTDSRYKYRIVLITPATRPDATIVAIIPTLESSVTGIGFSTGFHDVSDQNAKTVEILRNQLFALLEAKE